MNLPTTAEKTTVSQDIPQDEVVHDVVHERSYLVRLLPALSGKGFVLLPSDRRFLLGRGAHCDFEIPDPAASREHAAIEPSDDGLDLIDLESTNGTFVNDQPIDRHSLRSGDRIRVGSTVLKFLSRDRVEAQYHDAIHSMMITDPLTGVHNKRYFIETLERELVRAHRHRRLLCVVLFDIDHFKQVNDQFGHLAGDAVLRELTRRVGETIRKDEIIARLGGDEFGVLVPEADLPESHALAERVRLAIADRPIVFDRLVIPVTVSMGLAASRIDPPSNYTDLMAEADEYLYQAKVRGRNRVASRVENALPDHAEVNLSADLTSSGGETFPAM